MIFLSTLSYSTSANIQALQALVSATNVSSIGFIAPPDEEMFSLTIGRSFNEDDLRTKLQQAYFPYTWAADESRTPPYPGEPEGSARR